MSKPIYLMVTPFFPAPESWRGAFCYDFARAVQRTGKYDVRIVVPGRAGQGDYDYNGFKVIRFRNFKPFPGGFCRFLAYPFSRRSLGRTLRRHGIAARDIAVYHAHDVSLVPFSHGLKKANPNLKVMLHLHNGGHPFNLTCGRYGVIPLYSTLYYLYLRWSFEQVDIPVFVSNRQKDFFGKWYKFGFLKPAVDVLDDVIGGRWIRPIRLKDPRVLHNGIDYDLFNPRGRQPHDGFVVGCVGNVDFSKDQMTLLRAVRRLRDGGVHGLRVVIIGSGVALKTCKDFVAEKKLDEIVEFRTEVDHLKLPDIYRSFDLFVIPSYLEGFCCSYMEAYGCGTPVMGCKDVCLDEAIRQEDQVNWLIAPQDDEALARLIRRHYETPQKQTMIHDYDINRMVSAFLEEVGL